MAKAWYVVHTYSGFENKAKRALEERIKLYKLDDRFGKVHVPTEEVVEVKNGQKRTTSRKFYPGYILVEMELDNQTWHLVKETPKAAPAVEAPVVEAAAEEAAPVVESEEKAE